MSDNGLESELTGRLLDHLGDHPQLDPTPVVLAFRQYWQDPTMSLHDLRWMLYAENFFTTDEEFLKICFPFFRAKDMYRA